jgi:hypothetical protein
MDRFPEAFDRFEKLVDLRSFRSGRELKYAFSHWAGRRWVDSYLQNKALGIEAKKRGFEDIPLPRYSRRPRFHVKRTWRRETVTVRGKPQPRYRDLSTGRFIKKPE